MPATEDTKRTVIEWIVKNSKTGGHSEQYDAEELRELVFPDDVSNDLWEGAIGELVNENYLVHDGIIGRVFGLFRPSALLFQKFDKEIIGTDPFAAAKIVAECMANSDAFRSEEFMDKQGWSVRRINPALGIIKGMVGQGRIGRAINPDFIFLSARIDPEDKAGLRRFLNHWSIIRSKGIDSWLARYGKNVRVCSLILHFLGIPP